MATMKPSDRIEDAGVCLRRAYGSLEGLSVGDAFGERFFGDPHRAARRIAGRQVPAGRWAWTDDTAMAVSVVEVLERCGRVDPDLLAAAFARRYRSDPLRGYGPGMHRPLGDYDSGREWRHLAPALFGGAGSFGNGAAMRAAPIGAYFAADLTEAARHAELSAAVTHAHPDGIAGAVAVAVAAAAVAADTDLAGGDLLDAVASVLADGAVRSRVLAARDLPANTTVEIAAGRLGTGQAVSAADTVPFCLWCASRHPDDYQAALWATVAGLGDRDTTCAIVGGIVAARLGPEAIPDTWRHAREPLPRH